MRNCCPVRFVGREIAALTFGTMMLPNAGASVAERVAVRREPARATRPKPPPSKHGTAAPRHQGGEAVEAGDIAQMTCFANNHGALEDWAAWCRIRASLASPVVPVGVSKEEIIAILESYIGASTWPGDSDAEVHGISEAADAILAALRPDDTGRE